MHVLGLGSILSTIEPVSIEPTVGSDRRFSRHSRPSGGDGTAFHG